MVNSPLPVSLASEAKKAAKILKDFTFPSAKTGPDKIIPAGLLKQAKGLAILTVFKAGFLMSARGGSGIVIARLDDDSWSAPSAIGITGLGGGLEIGAEVTDFVIILNTRSAVEAFSKGGNLTLGGNFSVAAGPYGRNVEGDVAVRGVAAVYTYSKTKGLFAGVSIEGSGLIERKDANRKFYKDPHIRASSILGGKVARPSECSALYEVLNEHEQSANKAIVEFGKATAAKGLEHGVDRLKKGAIAHHYGSSKDRNRERYDSDTSKQSGKSSSAKSSPVAPARAQRSTRRDDDDEQDEGYSFGRSSNDEADTNSYFFGGNNKSKNVSSGLSAAAKLQQQRVKRDAFLSSGKTNILPRKVRAIHPYKGQYACDLSFETGVEIDVLLAMPTQDDWWEGKIGSRIGIFPANYTSPCHY